MGEDYRDVNRVHWDERAPAHAASADYAVERFVSEPAHLSSVVRFDLPRLGDVSGLRGVHLHCHIGTDTVSLARLGAHMSGLDFSPTALAEARSLAERTGTEVDFIEADAYDAVERLGADAFDLVFTGVGALCWLPDIQRWAGTVAGLLRPGGRLFLREGHPMLWALDESCTSALVVGYPYFEKRDALQFEEEGTYVETDVEFTANRTYVWNHGLGETVTALLDAGMELTALEEHDSAPWEALPGQLVRDDRDDEWRLTSGRERLPLTYTLQAVKRP